MLSNGHYNYYSIVKLKYPCDGCAAIYHLSWIISCSSLYCRVISSLTFQPHLILVCEEVPSELIFTIPICISRRQWCSTCFALVSSIVVEVWSAPLSAEGQVPYSRKHNDQRNNTGTCGAAICFQGLHGYASSFTSGRSALDIFNAVHFFANILKFIIICPVPQQIQEFH